MKGNRHGRHGRRSASEEDDFDDSDEEVRDRGRYYDYKQGRGRDDDGRRPRRDYDDGRNQRDPAYSGQLQRLDSIQDPGKRYSIGENIGSGLYGDVYIATDSQCGNKKVAVKIQKLTAESQHIITEEYKILRDFSGHPNLPDFYGVYRKRSGKKSDCDQIWFVMELCEGGQAVDIVRGLQAVDKKMKEEHISYILKETVKALVYLHENGIIHRDIRGSNILLTKEGEVKLADFGLSRLMKSESGKRRTFIGSPCWIAPEIISCQGDPKSGYGTRADVWAIGITAIELAEGNPPFLNMHPTRALFQIVRNPPPTLYRPANWTQNLNDFIAECLEKNPDNRPFMAEIMEHPFFSELAQNDYSLTQELKSLVSSVVTEKVKQERNQEFIVRKGQLKVHQTDPPEQMFTEDLAALENLTEDVILDELEARLRLGFFHTFVGDILLILNPNEAHDIYGTRFHSKYQFKSRSDNSPHIYAIADSAYQNVLHNEEPQHIILAGESNSGKTTNMMHIINHLMFLGKSVNDVGNRVRKAIQILHAFVNASTPLNSNSTRCIFQTQTTFGSTGKASGAIFWLYQLEKWRISTKDRNQSNFHIFYYFYDGMEETNQLSKYSLPQGRRLRYMRIGDKSSGKKRSFKVRNDVSGNIVKFKEIMDSMKLLELDYEIIWSTLAAILLMGDIKFVEGGNGEAEIANMDLAEKVAEILGLDSKKFIWSLINYCFIKKGSAIRRRHTCDEAKEARDVLANTIYQRLVDWLINSINHKLTVSRTLFGDKFSIAILDLFGFECFAINRIEQLFVNTMNEQLQYLYNQRIFAWEMQEQQQEEIPPEQFHFYDNKEIIDQLMDKDYGLFHIIDDTSRQQQDAQYILDRIKCKPRGIHVQTTGSHEFSVAHYTGKLVYDASEISEKNRDFLPPEVIETFRMSSSETVKQMFVNKLTKSGNLTIVIENPQTKEKKQSTRSKWGAALIQESTKLRKFNTESRGIFSQTRKMRTCAAVFRSISLEILKSLSIGSGNGGTHFVRCIRSDLEGKPRGFYRDVVRQQIRALAVVDTARARQRGYPYRIPFQEFLRRYKFLAFDFDETVDMTKENCRLLLIRLKMEGWVIGKTKVFLRYYNEEYLSRLYETQVKKIIKVQCMLRAFLARKTVAIRNTRMKSVERQLSMKKPTITREMTEDQAAIVLQKGYRGRKVRKEYGSLLRSEMSIETKDLMRVYFDKWRSKTIYQVLLQYRAARYQDLVQLSQQIHLYNQALVGDLHTNNDRVPLNNINPAASKSSFLGPVQPPQVHKLPFNLQQEMTFFDVSYMNEPTKGHRNPKSITSSMSDEEHEAWDAPLRRQTVPWANDNSHTRDVYVQTSNSPHRQGPTVTTKSPSLINTMFSRDPKTPVLCPPEENTQSRPQFGYQSQNIHSTYSSNPRATPSNYRSENTFFSSNARFPVATKSNNDRSTYQNDNYYGGEGRNRNVTDKYHGDRTNHNVVSCNRVDPIEELQKLGRRNSSDSLNDNPPFNFQALLRKTPMQRASMKRDTVYESNPSQSTQRDDYYSPQPKSNPNITNRHKTARDDTFNLKSMELPKKMEKRGDDIEEEEDEDEQREERERREQRQQKEEQRQSEHGEQEEQVEQEDTDDIEGVTFGTELDTTEIIPGYIMEGYTVDL